MISPVSPYNICVFSLAIGRNVSWGMPWAARAVSAAHSCGASSKLCWAAPIILVESYCKLGWCARNQHAVYMSGSVLVQVWLYIRYVHTHTHYAYLHVCCKYTYYVNAHAGYNRFHPNSFSLWVLINMIRARQVVQVWKNQNASWSCLRGICRARKGRALVWATSSGPMSCKTRKGWMRPKPTCGWAFHLISENIRRPVRRWNFWRSRAWCSTLQVPEIEGILLTYPILFVVVMLNGILW